MDNLSDSAMKVDHDSKTLHVCFQKAEGSEVIELWKTLGKMLADYGRAQAPIGWHMPPQMAEEIAELGVRTVKFYTSTTKERSFEGVIADVEITFEGKRDVLTLTRG